MAMIGARQRSKNPRLIAPADAILQIRLTHREKWQIFKLAQQAGLNVSAYIRLAALGHPAPTTPKGLVIEVPADLPPP